MRLTEYSKQILFMCAMLKVCIMPSHSSETLRCESYTTPRSVGIDSSLSKRVTKDPDEEANNSVVSPARDVKNRDGVRSAPSHFSPQVSQNLIERLVDNSEQCALEDTLVFESSVFDDWSEAASGWRVVVPYPKYLTQQPPIRHKSESALKKASVSSRTAVRCVDEDFNDEQVCPAWKANVEPVTYRYVPNNGYYRSHKSSNRDLREWLSVKKYKSEKSVVTPEVRHVQKTLKRDLEYHFKVPNEENTAAVQKATIQYHDSAVKPKQGDQRDRSHDVPNIAKRLPAREQQLVKSASDLFMENFNTRLNALEKEIHTPYTPAISKKPSDSPALNHSPIQITKKLKEVRITDTMKPTIQSTKRHGGNFGQDLFTVIPMCKREVPLRPLEKLTPKQKQMEKGSSRERSPSPEVHSQQEEEDEVEEEEDLVIMLASATTQPPPLPRDTDSSGINTARSAIAMTNFNIEKMRNIPLGSEFSDKQKSFVVQKGFGQATVRKGAMHYRVTNNNGRSPEQASSVDEEMSTGEFVPQIERRIEKEIDPIGMGSTLPEIMGKRLTVTTTTHRLL